MGFILSTAEKDLRRHARDPLAMVLWVGIPLLIGGLLILVMGGLDKAPSTAHLLVADEDGGLLSRLMSQAFGKTGSGQILHVEEVPQQEGRQRISRGEATALLVIPAGFGEAVLREKPTTLVLVTNPAQRILPKMVQEGLEIVSDGVFYLHRLAGPEIREIAEGPPQGQRTFTNDQIARISTAVNKVTERLQKYLFPVVLDVATSVDEQPGETKIDMEQLIFSGILFLGLVLMAAGLSSDFWREREQGTLRRAACTPASTMALLAGKLLAQGVLMLISASVVLLAGMLYEGLPLTKLPLLVAWAVSSGLLMLMILDSVSNRHIQCGQFVP